MKMNALHNALPDHNKQIDRLLELITERDKLKFIYDSRVIEIPLSEQLWNDELTELFYQIVKIDNLITLYRTILDNALDSKGL
jgi:hypothetical protein